MHHLMMGTSIEGTLIVSHTTKISISQQHNHRDHRDYMDYIDPTDHSHNSYLLNKLLIDDVVDF